MGLIQNLDGTCRRRWNREVALARGFLAWGKHIICNDITTKGPDSSFGKSSENVLLRKGAGVGTSIDFEEVCFVK